MAVNAAVLVWRFWLVMRYRPALPCGDHELKSCTVVIPAYNEGAQVLSTMRSVLASDFPAQKLQVICVDDGSRDDTWDWMLRGREEFGERVEIIRSPRNQGKRHALNHGFLRARGDILVTIDSDSEVEPRTLRNIVSAFCRNERVGAVAGNVRVLNTREGIIPRMLDVAFAFSFDFIRAAQSSINTVMCTPGALSAYDRAVVSKVRRKWLRQTFMGLPANIGEDRAMTNLILREGRLVHFQSDAVVYTNVPTGYRGLCKMLLRWARSNIRETIALSRFGFTRFRPEPVLGAQVDLCVQWLRMVSREVLKAVFLVSLVTWPLGTGAGLLTGTLFASALPALFYLHRHRSAACLWAFPYSLFLFLGLSWISLYALLTPYKNGWLTRQIAQPGPQRPVAQAMAQTMSQTMAAAQSVPQALAQTMAPAPMEQAAEQVRVVPPGADSLAIPLP
jgi:hyaluronan synthase